MTRAGGPSARALLIELLTRVGLKSPGLADGLDLNVFGIRLDSEGNLLLPVGYLNHIKRQHPHWFRQRAKGYANPDKLRRVVHPEFQIHTDKGIS